MLRILKNKLRKNVRYCHDNEKEASIEDCCIKISSEKYPFDELDRIPENYLPQDVTRGELSNVNLKDDPTPRLPSAQMINRQRDYDDSALQMDERVRVTQHSVVYNGSTAYLSNFYPSKFSFTANNESREYRCLEQAYAYLKCKFHNKGECANRVLTAITLRKIKSISGEFPTLPGWESISEDLMERLMLSKYDQN